MNYANTTRGYHGTTSMAIMAKVPGIPWNTMDISSYYRGSSCKEEGKQVLRAKYFRARDVTDICNVCTIHFTYARAQIRGPLGWKHVSVHRSPPTYRVWANRTHRFVLNQ